MQKMWEITGMTNELECPNCNHKIEYCKWCGEIITEKENDHEWCNPVYDE